MARIQQTDKYNKKRREARAKKKQEEAAEKQKEEEKLAKKREQSSARSRKYLANKKIATMSAQDNKKLKSTSLETPTPPYYYSPAPSPYQQIHTESIGRQHEGRMQSRTLNNMNAPIGLNPVSLLVGVSSVWLIVSAAVIARLCLDCDSICDSF